MRKPARLLGLVVGCSIGAWGAAAEAADPKPPEPDPQSAPAETKADGAAAPGADPAAAGAEKTAEGAKSAEAAPPADEPKPAEPSPIDVSVGGTRLEQTSGSAHVISPKQKERFKFDDPHKVLLGVTGVYVRGEDGVGLRPNIGMRGAMSDRSKKVTLLEDGVLLGPAPYAAPAAYYIPLITRMYSVRVVKGPATISHGPHTVAGSIDFLTTPIPDKNKTMIDIAVGQYLFRKVHLRQAVATDTMGILIEGVHLGTTGFKAIDGGGDTGFSRNEWMAKARYLFGSADTLVHEVGFKVGYSDENSNETYLGLTDADFRESPYRRYAASQLDHMEWHRTQVELTHKATAGGDLSVTTTLYRHDLGRVWRKVNGFRGADIREVLSNPTAPANKEFYDIVSGKAPAAQANQVLYIGPNDRRFVSQGIQSTVAWSTKTGPVSHRLEFGFRLHNDSVHRVHTQDGFFVDGQSLTPEGSATETTADNVAEAFALSGYAMDVASWKFLTLTAGVRAESIQSRQTDTLEGKREWISQQVLLPGAGLFAQLPAAFGLFAGAYQGFSPIPPGQTSDVRTEKSWNYEVGVRWSPKRPRVRAEVIGFFNDYQNLSNICTQSTGCVDQNLDRQFDGGAVRVAGVEAYVESEAKISESLSLPARIAYTFTDARFATSFTSSDPLFGDVVVGDIVPYIPPHQLTASLGVEAPKWGINAGLTYIASMREVAGQGEPGPGEATDEALLLDLSASVKPLSWLTVYLNGRNLTDSAYIASRRPFGARPGAPLWIQGGAKAEF